MGKSKTTVTDYVSKKKKFKKKKRFHVLDHLLECMFN